MRKHNLLSEFQHTNKTIFWKDVRKIIYTNNRNRICIDGISDPDGIVDNCDKEYKLTPDDANSQSEPTVDSNGGNAYVSS